MFLSVRHRPLVLALLGASALLPGAVFEETAETPVQPSPLVHFLLVAAGALAAATASAGLTAVGVRRSDGRTVLLGTAFSTMTALLAVHGIATPGVLAGPNGVVALAGAAGLPVGGAILALSALPALRRPRRVRPLLALQAVLAAGVLALGIAALAAPSLVPALPKPGSTPAIALLVVGLGFYALLAGRAIRTYALTHRLSDMLVAVGCVWLGLALLPQLIEGAYSLSFYLAHIVELAGVLLLGIPAVIDLRRGAPSRPLVGDLRATEIVMREEGYLGARVRALLVELARKDCSTEEHTRRVAMLAVQVGEELGLPYPALRQPAIGGLLHDIGKLAVPAEILQKPAQLDDDEFEQIKRHPTAGRKLLSELGGFAPAVHRLVLSHHERLDGAGYPHGLGGADIDGATRILAVCDVYDALVSDRVYRPAWSSERALELLRSEAGSAFDGRCVHALARVVERACARKAVQAAW